MNLTGTKKAEVLNGTIASDTIRGRKGADVIYGNDGTDTLYGGRGHDVFIFNDADNDSDLIADFDPRRDTVILDLGDDFTAWSVDYTDVPDTLTTGDSPEPIGGGLSAYNTLREVAIISEIGGEGDFSLVLI